MAPLWTMWAVRRRKELLVASAKGRRGKFTEFTKGEPGTGGNKITTILDARSPAGERRWVSVVNEACLFPKRKLEWEESKQHPGVMLSSVARDRPCSKLTSYVVTVPVGGQVKPHMHEEGVTDISFIVSGEGLALINGDWVNCGSGDYFVVPPRIEHGVRNKGNEPMAIFALLVSS